MSNSSSVALLVTCLVDQILPEIGIAAVRLLQRAGYEVEFPVAQTCCGQPFFNSGFRPQAADLATRTIEIFEPYAAVVLPSGSCAAMIRTEYAHLFAEEPAWQARAEQLAAKTHELTEFLVRVANWDPVAAAPQAVTYHDSCHMCRLLHLRDEPRQLLEAAGCSLREMEEPDRCCGFGGLFSIRLPEVANAMSAEKLRQALGSGASTLVTADPGCLMQLRGLLDDAELDVRAEHVAVVLEEQTR